MASATSIAVFLGANVGNDSKFEKMVREVASLFVENNWKLGTLPVFMTTCQGLQRMASIDRTWPHNEA